MFRSLEEAVPGWLFQTSIRQVVLARLNGNLYKSPDLSLLESAVLPPRNITPVPIKVPPGMEPYLNLPSAAFHYAIPSTRSRYAQLGLGVLPNSGAAIAGTLEPLDPNDQDESIYRIYRAGSQEGYKAVVYVENYTPQAIALDANSRLFRIFDWGGRRLSGSQLTSLVNPKDESGEHIIIDGEKGRDWQYEYRTPNTRNDNDIVGVRVRINPDRFYLPKISDEPIKISDHRRDYRAEIDRLLQPIPITDERILWIGETPRMSLSQNIDAVLDRTVFPNMYHWYETDPNDEHIESQLVDGGSNHPIRIEVRSRTTKDEMPNSVSYAFVLNKQAA